MSQRLAVLLAFAACIAALSGCRTPSPPGAGSAVIPAVPTPEPERAWDLLYISNHELVRQRAVADGERTVIASGLPEADMMVAAQSPDGTKIAWGSAMESIRVAVLDTGDVTEVARLRSTLDYFDGPIVWSPDSALMAYVDDGYIFIVSEGNEPRQLTKSGEVTDLCWSPDGRTIAYCRRGGLDEGLGLWSVPVEGGDPFQIVPGTGDVYAASDPSWSPDGSTIAFLHAWEGGALCFVSPDGTNARLDFAEAWHPLLWLGDSSAVVYDSTSPEGPLAGVKTCTPAGTPKPIIDGLIFGYDLLPDGRLLVLSGEGGDPESEPVDKLVARVLHLDSQKTDGGYADILPGSHGACKWRPDGEEIAVLAFEVEPPGTLYAADVGGQEKPTPRASDVEEFVGWVKAAE